MDKCVLCDNKYNYKCPKCLSKICSLICSKSHNCKNNKYQQQMQQNKRDAKNEQQEQQDFENRAANNGLEQQQKHSAAPKEENKTDSAAVSENNEDVEIKKILKECKLLDKISGRLESTARFILNPILFGSNSYRSKKLVKKTCNNKKININYSPIIFKRNKLNKNFIKNNIIYWTVEWFFPELNISLMSQRVCEKEKLVEAYENLVKNRKTTVPSEYRDSNGISVLVRHRPGRTNENEFYKCNLDEPIADNLTNTSVVDFPTFCVILKKDLEKYKILEKEGDSNVKE